MRGRGPSLGFAFFAASIASRFLTRSSLSAPPAAAVSWRCSAAGMRQATTYFHGDTTSPRGLAERRCAGCVASDLAQYDTAAACWWQRQAVARHPALPATTGLPPSPILWTFWCCCNLRLLSTFHAGAVTPNRHSRLVAHVAPPRRCSSEKPGGLLAHRNPWSGSHWSAELWH